MGNRERETRTGFTVPPNYSVKQCYDALKSPAWSFDYDNGIAIKTIARYNIGMNLF